MRRVRSIVPALLLVMGLAPIAAAQTVAVRSGEHETFSRLVLTLPAGAGWSTERTDEGYRVVVEGRVSAFDITQVFERIPRDRITAVAPVAGETALDIAVACDCRMEAFGFDGNRLVVDVIDGSDGDAPVTETRETAVAESGNGAARTPLRLPLFTDRTAVPAPTFTSPLGETAARSPSVAETERAILESFARAASQGVFDFPATIAPVLPEAAERTGSEVPVSPGLSPVTDPMDGIPLPDPGDGPRPGMILRTGIARGEETIFEPLEDEAAACSNIGRLDVAAWSGERDFFDLVGEGRLALTTDTGRIVAPQVLELARRYVAFGFGLEALATLQLLGAREHTDAAVEVETLATLARVVDGATDPRSGLARSEGCGPEAALWATLARGTLEGTDDAHRDAALVGYRDLPDALQGHLGLRLASLFSEAGEHLIADEILATARSHVTGGGIAADLAAAELAGAEHGPEAEIAHLETIADHNMRVAPETVTRLLDLGSAEGRAADPAVLDLASTLRFEAEGSGTEVDLARAEVRALIVGDGFDAALDLVEETRATLGEETAADLIDTAVAAMTERADDETFLGRVLTLGPGGLSAAHQNAVAARLLSLGLPDLALGFVAGEVSGDDLRERRYLRAGAAAAMGDPRAVDVALEGMRDPRAQEIRAQARAVTGDFADLETFGANDVAASWRAGDWVNLEASDDALLSTASRAALSEVAAPEGAATLAERQSLLDEAESTRAMTEALLERFVVDDG